MIKATKKTQEYDVTLPKTNDKDKLIACIEIETNDTKTITFITIDPKKALKPEIQNLKFEENEMPKSNKLSKASYITMVVRLQRNVREFLKRKAIYSGNVLVCSYI